MGKQQRSAEPEKNPYILTKQNIQRKKYLNAKKRNVKSSSKFECDSHLSRKIDFQCGCCYLWIFDYECFVASETHFSSTRVFYYISNLSKCASLRWKFSHLIHFANVFFFFPPFDFDRYSFVFFFSFRPAAVYGNNNWKRSFRKSRRSNKQYCEFVSECAMFVHKHVSVDGFLRDLPRIFVF